MLFHVRLSLLLFHEIIFYLIFPSISLNSTTIYELGPLCNIVKIKGKLFATHEALTETQKNVSEPQTWISNPQPSDQKVAGLIPFWGSETFFWVWNKSWVANSFHLIYQTASHPSYIYIYIYSQNCYVLGLIGCTKNENKQTNKFYIVLF